MEHDWFNPPFSKNVNTNIGQHFLRLMNKNFPKGSVWNKIFNKNTIKLGYSCMPNKGSIIKNHNNKILKNNVLQEPEQKKCNCQVPDQCPLNGKCLTTCVVYKADVITDDNKRQYTGLTEGTFKLRYYNHQLSLRDRKYSNSTELS